MTEWQNRNLGLKETHPLIVEMADRAQDLAKAFSQRDNSKPHLVLCGNTGCGKTHTARSLYNWARTRSGLIGVSVEWFSWQEACSAFEDGYAGVIRDMIEADFLALDDVGAETDKYKSGVMVDRLCQVLNRREKKFTVITTNIAPGLWSQRLDYRVADRLLRSSTIVDLTGVPSYAVLRIMEAA